MKRHILIVSNSLLTQEHASRGGTWLLTQARAYRAAGIKVGIVCIRQRTGARLQRRFFDGPRWEAVAIDREIPVYVNYAWSLAVKAPLVKRFKWLAPYLYLLTIGSVLRYVAAHGRPDLIHAHCGQYAGLPALVAARLLRVPLVITEHQSIYARNDVNPVIAKRLRWTFHRAQAVTTVSPRLKQDLARWCGIDAERIRVIPNMVDEALFTPQAAAVPGQDFYFAVVGRLKPVKNHTLFVEAFARAFPDDETMRAIVVGTGPLRDALERRAKDLGVASRIEFVGGLEADGVRDVLRGVHVLVQSSNYETFGLPLIEALSCGKPVISTDCGGPDSIINDKVGRLVPPNDPKALAEAMRYMHEHHRAFHPEYLREHVLTHFSRSVVMGQIGALYDTLLG